MMQHGLDTSTRALRMLVVFEWVLVALGVPIAIALEAELPASLLEYIETRDADIPLSQLVLWAFLLLAAVATSIGVFRLWPPARIAYTLLFGIGWLATPLLGHTVAHAWESLVTDIASAVPGAILALLWLSPAAAHFARRVPPNDPGARPTPIG